MQSFLSISIWPRFIQKFLCVFAKTPVIISSDPKKGGRGEPEQKPVQGRCHGTEAARCAARQVPFGEWPDAAGWPSKPRPGHLQDVAAVRCSHVRKPFGSSAGGVLRENRSDVSGAAGIAARQIRLARSPLGFFQGPKPRPPLRL